MRRRFFVDQVRNSHAEISGEEARHLSRVLRVEAGQRYEISDNHNVYLAEIETARKEQVIFRTLEKLEAAGPPVRMILYASLVKFERFEWMIEKATELGVERIIPVVAIRTEKGLDKAALKRMGRWQRIALEASQQSRRAFLPEIEEPCAFAQAAAMPAEARVHRYALDEEPGGVSFISALPQDRRASDRVAILVGPEGGWAPDERDRFAETGWTRITMGPLILRAETAATAALAVINNAWMK
jgi:16S rRNA (uracil1498-N3)-methyltransferase